MKTTWLTLREAATVSGLSPVDVLDLCRSCIMRARTARGRWRVHRGDFVVWMCGGAAGSRESSSAE
jgi:hypothetical protein